MEYFKNLYFYIYLILTYIHTVYIYLALMYIYIYTYTLVLLQLTQNHFNGTHIINICDLTFETYLLIQEHKKKEEINNLYSFKVFIYI